MIHVANLWKRFGNTIAVKGISFDISKGETFGLLGPNGAGKSTTIRMIIGATAGDDGTVRLNALDPTSAKTRQLVGVAPQSLALYDELTALENLKFFGQLYGLSGSELLSRVEYALEFAALTDRKKAQVSTFSGGMKRRLNMACAVIHDPQVILLDEPTVGVDPQSRNHIFDRIESLKEDGRTILYTTHYMEEAERLCDRIAIMDHGELLDVGTLDDLLSRHGSQSRVECQVGEIPAGVNLPGVVEDDALRFSSDDPIQTIASLANDGVDFRSLKLMPPNLEDVFLSLTGKSLRDST